MAITRRHVLKSGLGCAGVAALAFQQRRPPNVLLILSDDQGYGDLSCHGNDKLRTPAIDSIAHDGVQFAQFHVSAVCSPTRSSLMTGRYHYRTGVIDTAYGRSLMYPDEITIAELFRRAGYRTGIFGKWHLGDNYPLRAMDHGFEEAVVHGGGGITQGGDWPGNTYFSPVLLHNGKPHKYQGYCTDIFARECMQFMEKHRAEPFFAYLAFNAPHGPLEVDESYAAPFRKAGLNDSLARLYGMIVNMDENVARILKQLSSLELERETIVIFMTDNGPGFPRFNGGMRGYKGTQYEGGIRVPFFLRWPGVVEGGRKLDRMAVHMDVLPTLAELCGVELPRDLRLDGRSLAPLLRGGIPGPDRELFFQWHPGDEPELYRNCAVHGERFKLVHGRELFDLLTDPEERNNIAGQNRELVGSMRRQYEQWFQEMASAHGFAPPSILIGTEFENPTRLSRQDLRGPSTGWEPESFGYWQLEVAKAGTYRIRLEIFPPPEESTAHFKFNGAVLESVISQGAKTCDFDGVHLPPGPGRLEAFVLSGYKKFGAKYVELERS